MQIGLVIMASGKGRRFGSQKLLAMLGGKPLIRWIIDATEGLFDRRIVVTRDQRIQALCNEYGIRCICHDLPRRNDTVRLGLKALRAMEDDNDLKAWSDSDTDTREDVDVCFFVPGDQPLIRKETMVALIEAAKNNKERIIRAGYGSRVGSPVGFSHRYFEELMNLPEGKGGNYVAGKYPEDVMVVPVERECELWDVDTVEDLEKVSELV